MKVSIRDDLEGVTELLRRLVKTLPKLTREERVDVCARVRSIGKHVETIDKSVKDEIKTFLKERDGTVKGEQWKANLKYNPVTRLNQTRLKEQDKATYDAYCETNDEGRITFEARLKEQIMTNKKAYDAIMRARTRLVVSQPFFGCLAIQLELVEVNDPTKVDTMAVDGRHMFYHPPFVLKLSEEELVGVVAHEVMHCVYSHFSRRGHRNHVKFNIAGDFRINYDLLEVPFTLPGKPCGIADFGKMQDGIFLYDKQFANMSTEEIYERIPDPPEGQGSSDPGGCGSVMDAGGAAGDKAVADQVAHEWEINVRVAVSVARANNAGKTPGYLERVITQLKRPKVSWRELTQQFIDQSMTKDYSYKRPNKRYAHAGFIMPGFVPDALHEMVMILDCSGSISNEMMRSYVSEVAGALDQGTTDKLIVVYADTMVQGVDEFYPGDLVTCRTVDGGGTNFDEAFKWVAKNAADTACIIYLTDMETCSFGKEPLNTPVLWAAYNTEEHLKGIKAPFGNVIHIESVE